MPNTHSNTYHHCVFSTKHRQNLLSLEIQPVLFAYMGGIARNNRAMALAIGGMEDHVHILVSSPTTIPIAKSLQLIKGNSSKWLSQSYPELREFEWQEGYGAFCVGHSQLTKTIRYINSQKKHHEKKSSTEEYIEFLIANGIDPDPKYL